MGGAAGEAFTNTLASAGMPLAAVLAREAIQNSVDAKAAPNSKVRVRFTTKLLSGAAKAGFVEAAGLNAVRERADKLGVTEPNCLGSLDDESQPIRLLYVDDWNTTGLEGNPSDPDSKFYRFLLSLGDAGKEHDEHGTGGSYGYGKSVYSSNSAILTIFAYSRTHDEEGNLQSLLFGCGYYRKHKNDGENLTGRAWFGSDMTPPHQHALQIVAPLRDEEADQVAQALGFEPRSDKELGTGVLIIDSLVDSTGILLGIEDWWWPRLIDNLLDVDVVNEDGSTDVPRPRKRDDLRPFIEAYEVATGKSPPQPKLGYRQELNKFEGERIGTIGLRVLERDNNDEYPIPEARFDTVALIRSPLMVVAYLRQWQVGTPLVAGAFVANSDIDDILRASEPPAHDRWDSDTRRLKDASGRRKRIVDRVLNRVKHYLKTFQSSAAPPPSPRPKRLSLLERTLATFLAPGRVGPPPPPPAGSAPISLHYQKAPRPAALQDGRLELTTVFTVELADDEISELTVRVRVRCPLLEDGKQGDDLPIVVQSSVGNVPDPEKPEWMQVTLTKGEPVKFECISDPYDAAWTVRFVPEIEPVE